MTPTSKHISVKYHRFREHMVIDFFINKTESTKKGWFFTKELQENFGGR